MAAANSINESTIGICGFTGTAFVGTAVTQYNVIIGSTSSTLANVAPSAAVGNPLLSAGSSANPAFGTHIVADSLALPASTSATVGVITVASNVFMNGFGGSTYLGPSAGNATASSGTNVGIGDGVLKIATTANTDTAVGYQSMASMIVGGGNTAVGSSSLSLGTGDANTCIGANSLKNVTTGTYNDCSGINSGILLQTGSFNCGFGAGALNSCVSGTLNTCVGYLAGSALTTNDSNNIEIQHTGVVGDNGVIRIGTASQTTCFIAGINGVTASNPVMVTINSSTNQLGVASIITGSFNNAVVQVFTGNGTYTPTAGMKYCIIEMVGGGGGGGAVDSTGTNVFAAATGGGGGEYARGRFTAANIGGSQTVTIGAGGSSASGGGTTSVGSLITAVGGSAGATVTQATVGTLTQGAVGAIGGTGGTGGSFRVDGGMGGSATGTSAGQNIISGYGGSSHFSGQVASNLVISAAVAQTSAGIAATGYGGGGGGALNYSTQASGNSGGAGSGGIVVITEFVSA